MSDRLPILLVSLILVSISATSACAARALVTVSERSAVRSGPTDSHARITVLPPTARLWATGRVGTWYKVSLYSGLDGWIAASDVKELGTDVKLDTARLTDMSLSLQDGRIRVLMYLTDRVPFRIRQSVFPAQLDIDLFRCAAAQEGIRQFPGVAGVIPLVPQQMANDWTQITLQLPNVHQAGYRASYTSGGHLVVDINPSFADAGIAGKRIAIDPGHGGPDSGAVGPTRVREKDVNLAISMLLARRLQAEGAQVILTRDRDTAVSPGAGKGGELAARVDVTKAANADLFISVHNNAVGGGNAATAKGSECYYWTPMSRLLAIKLQEGLVSALGTRDRFVGWQRFAVLRETDCPRALVECAFMSNPQEEKLLADPKYQSRAAEGLYAGIKNYLAEAVTPPGPMPDAPVQDTPRPDGPEPLTPRMDAPQIELFGVPPMEAER